MIGLEAWFASGQRVPVPLPGQQPVHLFCRVEGNGPWATLLHGFPTCSWDWADITEALSPEHQLLLPDLLGFGDSDKPPRHTYSLLEQAHLVESLWRHFGVAETALIAHDIGASVAQELLARQSDGRLQARLTKVVSLNAALYHGISRPRLAQHLLANGLLGPLLAPLLTQRLFSRNLAAVFSKAHPLSPDRANAYWRAFRRHAAAPHIHRLLQYIPERQHHHARWEAALERSTVPLSFIWGLQDPVSGGPMAGHIRSRLPTADFTLLDDAGHYPQLEVPERVSEALAAALRTRA